MSATQENSRESMNQEQEQEQEQEALEDVLNDWVPLSSQDSDYLKSVESGVNGKKEEGRLRKKTLTVQQQIKRFMEDAKNGHYAACLRDLKEGVCINGADPVSGKMPLEWFLRSIKSVNQDKINQIQGWLEQGALIENSHSGGSGNVPALGYIHQNPAMFMRMQSWLEAWLKEDASYRSRVMNRALDWYSVKMLRFEQKHELDEAMATIFKHQRANVPKHQETWDACWLAQYGTFLRDNHEALWDQALRFFDKNPYVNHQKAYASWFEWSFEWFEKRHWIRDNLRSIVPQRTPARALPSDAPIRPLDFEMEGSVQNLSKSEEDDRALNVLRAQWTKAFEDLDDEKMDWSKSWKDEWVWITRSCLRHGSWRNLEKFREIKQWTPGELFLKLHDFMEQQQKVRGIDWGMFLSDFEEEEGHRMLMEWAQGAQKEGVRVPVEMIDFIMGGWIKSDDVEALKECLKIFGTPKDWIKQERYAQHHLIVERHWVEMLVKCNATQCLEWLKDLPSFKASRDFYQNHTLEFDRLDWKQVLLFEDLGFKITQTKNINGDGLLAAWIREDYQAPRSGYASVIRLHPHTVDQLGGGGKTLNELIDQKNWSASVKQELKKSISLQIKNQLLKEVKPKSVRNQEVEASVRPKAKRL